MKIQIDACLSRQVTAPPPQVYHLLIDVPDSMAHFPRVESLSRQTDHRWVWRMRRVGARFISVKAWLGLHYQNDPEALRIDWTPLEGLGNSRAFGSFQVEPWGTGSRVTFTNRLELTLPHPGFLRTIVQAYCAWQHGLLVDAYMDNLAKTFNGANGRLRPARPLGAPVQTVW